VLLRWIFDPEGVEQDRPLVTSAQQRAQVLLRDIKVAGVEWQDATVPTGDKLRVTIGSVDAGKRDVIRPEVSGPPSNGDGDCAAVPVHARVARTIRNNARKGRVFKTWVSVTP